MKKDITEFRKISYNKYWVCIVKLAVTHLKNIPKLEGKMNKKEFAESLSDSERRGSDRKKLIIDVHFSGGDATGIANTRDIGIGGLYMTTNTQLNIGTSLFMRMSVGDQELALGGVVVYSDPGHGVGIRFQDLSKENEGYIKEALLV